MKKELNLLNGTFNQADGLDLLSKFLEVKINFHENKIKESHQEEDIKMRENRIKQLQSEFNEVRETILKGGPQVDIHAKVSLE